MLLPRLHHFLASLALLVPLLAGAQLARISTDADLRSGPADDYPLVATLSTGVQVSVQGCVPDYSWCDVLVAGTTDLQGWVYGGNLVYPYQSSWVPILGYGPQIGLVVEPFLLDEYWERHYRDRPWYPDRGQHRHAPQRSGGPELRPPQPNHATTEELHPAPASPGKLPAPSVQTHPEGPPRHDQAPAQAERPARPEGPREREPEPHGNRRCGNEPCKE